MQLQTQANFTSMRWRWGEQLFGTFSWLDIRLPGPAYGAVWWGLKLTLAVTVAWLILQVVLAVRHLARRGWKRDPSRLTSGLSNPTRTWLSLANLIGVFVALYAAGYLYFRFSGRDELLQGRYALLALPALLAMPALALEGLLARLRWPWARWLPGATMCAIALAMWVLQVIGVAAIADRFYL